MEMSKNQRQLITKLTSNILSENCSFSSIPNEVNHEAKISVAEEIRDPKQLWNLKSNLNKTKRESSSNSEEGDRIVVAMKLEHGKSFIRNVTILPQYYIVFSISRINIRLETHTSYLVIFMEAKKRVFIFWLSDATDVPDFNVKLESLNSV